MIIDGVKYREVRCFGCKNFIVYEADAIGTLAYKCPKCNKLNVIKLTVLETKANIEKIGKYLIKPKGGDNK